MIAAARPVSLAKEAPSVTLFGGIGAAQKLPLAPPPSEEPPPPLSPPPKLLPLSLLPKLLELSVELPESV